MACLGCFVLPVAAVAAIDYEPKISGVKDSALLDNLKALSQLFALKNKPPLTLAELSKRAADDVARLIPAVQGAGYWSARLDFLIDQKRQPVRVTIEVVPGPLYHVKTVTLVAPSGGPPPPLADNRSDTFGLKPGDLARTDAVLAAEQAIPEAYANEGRPFAKVTSREVVVDRATDTMDVTYTVDAGPVLRFGAATIAGLEHTDPDYVRLRLKWRTGAIWDARLVTQTTNALVATNLFSTVRIEPAPAPAPDGTLPVTISLAERVRHTVGAGIDYDTSEGFGANASWSYRNIFGEGEELSLLTELAQQRLGALARFRKPDFIDPNQDLRLEAELVYENPDPYTARRIRLFAGVDRHLSPQLTLSGGVQAEKASVTENAIFDSVPADIDYTMVSAPVSLRRDTSDSQLNPTRGDRASMSVTPYASVARPTPSFLIVQGKGSAYQKLTDSGDFVLAEYAGLGSIVGGRTETIPADKRLYLGGGDSVRGYGYQRVGPLAPNTLPIGGVSSAQAGIELRTRITETIGLVPFFEGGNVYDRSMPELGHGLYYGAGLGVRYYTPIGPLRLDVAVPLDKRGSDAAFQLYVSIGQAF